MWARIEGVEYKSQGRSISGHFGCRVVGLKAFNWAAMEKYGNVFLKTFA